MNWFLPRYYVKSFDHISIPRLQKEGIRLLLCDIDNTLVSYDEPRPNQRVIDFVHSLQKAGIEVALCSNATPHRAMRFSKDLSVSRTYSFSCKPLPFNFYRAMKEHGYKREEIALVGDQLFTDMLGGNLFGLYTILSAPISEKDSIQTRFNRFWEQIVYRNWEKKNKLKRGEFDG